MKKSRLFRASVLLLVISLMLSLANTTFSWFSRPESLTGKNLILSDSYDTSVNSDAISFNTYESLDDGETYAISPITSLNPTIGIGAGERKCYRTDIVNTGTDPQSVSLYLQSLEKGANCGGITLGVNGPSKTYRPLSENNAEGKVKSDIYLQKVYVALNYDQAGYLNDHIWKIHYWNNNSLEGDVFWNEDYNTKRFYLDGNTGLYVVNGDGQYFEYHAITIDARACRMMLARSKDNWLEETKVQIFQNDDYTTNYIENNVLCYYDNNNKYGNSDFRAFPAPAGEHARLHTFYSSASVTEGNTIDLKATAWGHKISYSSSNKSVATVDSNGVVTAKKAGTAKITVRVDGPIDGNDYLEATCNLTVSSASTEAIFDVPVATNMVVEGATTNSRGETVNGVTSVYWYIKNDSTVNGMTYTIPEIYVTL